MGREKNHSTEKEMSCEELEAPGEGTEVPWGGDQTPGGQHWLRGGVIKRSEHSSSGSLNPSYRGQLGSWLSPWALLPDPWTSQAQS